MAVNGPASEAGGTRAGVGAVRPAAVPEVVAMIHAFNEELIVETTLRHLIDQGIGVYFLDNHSTDATPLIAESFLGKGVVGIEKFPLEAQKYNLVEILERKTRIASELAKSGARWMIHYDADEIRESPWMGVSLLEGLRRVAREGYNVVDHVVVNFVPTDENFRGENLEEHFQHYLPEEKPKRHGKAWIQGPQAVDLATYGGHFVKFKGRKVYPVPFVIKHYPILSTEHGKRKVFRERKPRYSEVGLAHGWHTHYNHIQSEDHSFVYRPDDPRLRRYDERAFKEALLARPRTEKHGILRRIFSAMGGNGAGKP